MKKLILKITTLLDIKRKRLLTFEEENNLEFYIQLLKQKLIDFNTDLFLKKLLREREENQILEFNDDRTLSIILRYLLDFYALDNFIFMNALTKYEKEISEPKFKRKKKQKKIIN